MSLLKGIISTVKTTFAEAFTVIRSPKEGFELLNRVSLYRNAGYIMLKSAGGAILGFVFWMIAARLYSSYHVGIASALIAGMGLLSSLSLLGLNIGLTRFLPQYEDKRGIINSCFTVVGIFSIVLATVFIVGTPLWSPPLSFLREDTKFLLSFVLFATVGSLLLIQAQTFIAFRSAKFAFAQQMVRQGLKVVLVTMLVSFGVFGIFSSWGIASLVALLVANLFLLRKVQPDYFPLPQIKKKVVNELGQFSLGNYGAEVISGAQFYILPLMIINILGAESSAYFRIAYGVADLLFMIPVAVTMALFAEGSRDPEKLHTNVLKAIKVIFLLLTPAILLVLFLGDKILLLFGSEYSGNALKLLWILALSSIPFAINELYVMIKRVELKVKPVVYTYSGIIIPVLGGSYILASKIGLTGVGFSCILGQGVVAIFISTLIIRWLRSNKQVESWGKIP